MEPHLIEMRSTSTFFTTRNQTTPPAPPRPGLSTRSNPHAQAGSALNCLGCCNCRCCCFCCCCSRSCCCTSLSAMMTLSPSTRPAARSALGVYTQPRSSGVRLASQSHTYTSTTNKAARHRISITSKCDPVTPQRPEQAGARWHICC